MTEIFFECYSAPSLAFGIDSLFSYKYNKGTTGLVVSSSHTSTHLIPVIRSKAVMSKRHTFELGRRSRSGVPYEASTTEIP